MHILNSARLSGGLLAAIVCFGGLAVESRAEFFVEDVEFNEKVKRIAVLPARIEIEVDDPYLSALEFDRLVTEYLDTTGIDYIPVQTYIEKRNETSLALGGSYDIYTGELDVEKAETIEDLTFREFERIHEFDAYLIPSIVEVIAPFYGNETKWDGVERFSTGGETGLLSGVGNLRGGMPASSFLGVLIDKTEADTTYFANRSGIELLTFVKQNMFGVSYVLREPPDRLNNTELNREAVETALMPLVDALAKSNGTPQSDTVESETASSEAMVEPTAETEEQE
ncbi:MAG: hypothetical protein AAGL69_14770 [Pseudomonadota bacterium]